MQRLLLRLAGAALLVSYVTVVLYGSLSMRPMPLGLLVVVLGTLGAALGRSIHRTLVLDCATWPGPVPAAAAAGLFVPFAKGVEQLGDAGGYLVVLLVVLSGVSSLVWAHDLAASAAPSHTAAGPARDPTARAARPLVPRSAAHPVHP